jgi:hypothetical protein
VTAWLRVSAVPTEHGKSRSVQNATPCIVSHHAAYLQDLRGRQIYEDEELTATCQRAFIFIRLFDDALSTSSVGMAILNNTMIVNFVVIVNHCNDCERLYTSSHSAATLTVENRVFTRVTLRPQF